MADNIYNQSDVGYQNSPKEVNNKRGMPGGNKQFGKGNKMPQDKTPATKGYVKKVMENHVKTMHKSNRHKEHR